MTSRLHHWLFMLAAGLLYLGPMLAGLAGFGWPMIPVFTAIFLLWLVVMRPAMWPQSTAEWSNPRLLLQVAGWVLLQAGLVTFCFVIGRGIGATMAGMTVSLPVWAPPLLSFLSVPLARSFWNPAAHSPEMEEFIDQATQELTAMRDRFAADAEADAAELAGQRRAAQAACAPLVARLAALAPDSDDARLREVLGGAGPGVQALPLLDALAAEAELARPGPGGLLRRAFILQATEPGVAETLLGTGQLARAFDLAGEDGPRLQLYAERTAALLEAKPLSLMDTPETARLRSMAGRHPAAAPALQALAAIMDRLDDA